MNRHSNRTRSLAMGGVFSALAIVLMLIGGYISIGTFVAPIFAGICLLPISMDVGNKWAVLCYIAVSAISLMLVPDQELVLFFIVLLGYYPMLQPKLARIRSKALRMGIKLLMFNASVAVVYFIMLVLFTSPALRAELSQRGSLFWAFLLVLANITFVLYDTLLDRVRIIYVCRIQNRLFR